MVTGTWAAAAKGKRCWVMAGTNCDDNSCGCGGLSARISTAAEGRGCMAARPGADYWMNCGVWYVEVPQIPNTRSSLPRRRRRALQLVVGDEFGWCVRGEEERVILVK